MLVRVEAGRESADDVCPRRICNTAYFDDMIAIRNDVTEHFACMYTNCDIVERGWMHESGRLNPCLHDYAACQQSLA